MGSVERPHAVAQVVPIPPERGLVVQERHARVLEFVLQVSTQRLKPGTSRAHACR